MRAEQPNTGNRGTNPGQKSGGLPCNSARLGLLVLLERIVPVRKGRPVKLTLPPVKTAADVVEAIGATVQAMADGEVTPEEAVTIASVLEAKRKAIETADLEARIVRLEQQTEKGR
jgi:hypothetical protein